MNKSKRITPFDIILIILASALVLFLSLRNIGSKSDYVKVECNGTDYKYSLQNDQKIILQGAIGPLTLVINNGKASITESTCKNQICVHMAPINRSGEFIACVPNKVLITVEGNENLEADDVAR